MTRRHTRSRHERAGQRTVQRMPGVYFDQREGHICITANATNADLSRLAELISKPAEELIRIKEKLDALSRVPESLS